MTDIEQQIAALNARLAKGSDWLDAECAWLTANTPGTAEYVQRHGQYVYQQDRWTTMLEELTALTGRCPHTQRELVRLVGEDGTSYPYVRCIQCHNNLAGLGVYLTPDAPALAGIVLDAVPVSGDYLTPPEHARLEAANAAGRAFEELGKPEAQAPLAAEERTCPNCDGPMTLRNGTAKTTGRPWVAWFCDDKCGQKPIFISERR